MSSHRLDRFKRAQDTRGAGFEAALAELRAGAKRGHWIWYVLPQISGLGTSHASMLYAIEDAVEAADYLRDPLLFSRLHTIVTTIAEHLRRGVSLTTLMGSRVDALKTVSSVTLFGAIAQRLCTPTDDDRLGAFARTAEEVLMAAEAEGYARCRHTLERLGNSGQVRPTTTAPRRP